MTDADLTRIEAEAARQHVSPADVRALVAEVRRLRSALSEALRATTFLDSSSSLGPMPGTVPVEPPS